jgi:GTP-binding protein
VLEQALKQKLKMIVLLNKIDRKDAEPERVLSQVEELFLNIAHDDSQLMFPVLYAVGRDGKAWHDLPSAAVGNADMIAGLTGDLRPIFEQIIRTVPAPAVDESLPFKMQISTLDFDSYKGTYAIGKVTQGQVKKGQRLVILDENTKVGELSVAHLLTSNGLNRDEIEVSQGGDIVALTGMDSIAIGQTVAALGETTGFKNISVTEPTLKIKLAANTSPFAGREGDFCTIRQIAERLRKEQKTNLGLRIEGLEGGAFNVAGRGELHLAILIETMRREGYEMELSKPEVIIKETDGVKMEPFEELTIEIDKDFIGVITEELGRRHAEMKDSITNEKGVTRMVYEVSSRNLLGFRSQILTKTRGNGLFSSRFLSYAPVSAQLPQLRNGALIATESGMVTAYALETIQERGKTFVNPGDQVYEGQIIGLRNQQEDLEVNACKAKKLTNFRSNADVMTVLDASISMSLEQCLDFIESDELLEVTPESLRLRKKHLSKLQRDRAR